MEPFIGQITIFGGNFAPRGWAFCDGQLLPIANYSALFALLGTTYGGDGRTTFALPDLRGRSAVHMGQGPGLSDYRIGQRGGAEVSQLGIHNLPAHNHAAAISGSIKQPVSSDDGDNDTPTDKYPAKSESDIYTDNPGSGEFGGALANDLTVNIGQTGSGATFNNLPPFLCVNYIIALDGVFPTRS